MSVARMQVITATYLLLFTVDVYVAVFKKDSLGAALGNLHRDKNPLVGGSREETAT
ncbi:hypothetical protein M405DRAFT_829244 [Rhizopogon salebrosus TDB-379]|nr:hypothetical protein M405DRAFT_829244 [Rhizopogon salebrosus TDB-379]